MNVLVDRFVVIKADPCNISNITIAGELTVDPEMPGRERSDVKCDADKILRLAGKGDHTVFIIAVIKGTNAYGVTGSYELFCFAVIDDTGKFRIQH